MLPGVGGAPARERLRGQGGEPRRPRPIKRRFQSGRAPGLPHRGGGRLRRRGSRAADLVQRLLRERPAAPGPRGPGHAVGSGHGGARSRARARPHPDLRSERAHHRVRPASKGGPRPPGLPARPGISRHDGPRVGPDAGANSYQPRIAGNSGGGGGGAVEPVDGRVDPPRGSSRSPLGRSPTSPPPRRSAAPEDARAPERVRQVDGVVPVTPLGLHRRVDLGGDDQQTGSPGKSAMVTSAWIWSGLDAPRL